MKNTPIMFTSEEVGKIIKGRKTMAMIPFAKFTIDDEALPERPCPFGEVGDWLTVHPSSAYGTIRLEILAIRRGSILGTRLTDADAKAMGHDNVRDFLNNDPIAMWGFRDAEVWVCEFKRMEATE